MKVTFAKRADASCETTIARSDGVLLAIVLRVGGSQLMPHDLMHFIVEAELGLQQGFWGCAAAGAVFGGMEVVSGRRPPHADEISREVLRAAGQRLIEAEELVTVVARAALAGLDRQRSGRVARRIDTAWRPHGTRRPDVTPDQARRVCEALRSARSAWSRLEVGGALAVRWPLPIIVPARPDVPTAQRRNRHPRTHLARGKSQGR